MTGFYLISKKSERFSQVAKEDIARWLHLKRSQESSHHSDQTEILSLVGSRKHPQATIARSPNGDWLCATGAWVHNAGIRYPDSQGLLSRYLQVGAAALAKELDGTFAIAIGDKRSHKTIVITDPRGSLHVYLRDDCAGVAICTSSMALSQSGQLDPVGAYEFIATGVIYEDRSLWAGIHKLPPATILEIERGHIARSTTYWSFADALAQRLTLEEAAEALVAATTQALKTIGTSYAPILADLTGGYDSRLLLLGLLKSGVRFDNTVVGSETLPDVIVASRIASALGLRLQVMEEAAAITPEDFDQAVRLGDGEINAFEYAAIKRNQAPFVHNHGISLNGSFGEVARGYWWELLWPKLNACEPLNATMLSRKRFAALPFTEVFKTPPVDSLSQHLAGVVTRTIAPAQGLSLTAQMDCVYLGMRMQRWQGRIASNTNQIWPAMAPFGFSAVLTPMLAAWPAGRIRSLLPRYVFSQYNPALANIPLEHGYPPTVANLGNLHRFYPVVEHYGHKVIEKLKGKLARPVASTQPPSAQRRCLGVLGASLPEVLKSLALLNTGLFAEANTARLLDPDTPIAGHRLTQWQRLLTIEYTLRAHAAARADS
ncbi:asparagine synthetase B family protein [Rhodoferax antarcticus]|uniref:hypothetical protein n=1 Tax=Rhodoferax antarcticus TaxID=81479 RepID=UPI0022256BE1|nr:hypothetical protein [Rhodoferax antarcticus]MCW2314379.1 asparagine synthase (glutamine-hydrolyzing) [Rhodoferax antarcticus]